MKEYVYLVHGTNDPVEGDNVLFNNKMEAIEYAKEYDGATVDLVESDGGAFTGCRIQVYGPEVDKVLASSDADHNSCRDIDCPVGSEMNPTSDDDLFDKDDLENEGYDDRRNHDPINRRERVNTDVLKESDDSDLDRIESEFKSRFARTSDVNESLTEEAGDDFSRIEAAFNAKFGNLDNDFEENLEEDIEFDDNGLDANTIRNRLTDFAKKFDKLDLGK